jgi:hypothetical protein
MAIKFNHELLRRKNPDMRNSAISLTRISLLIAAVFMLAIANFSASAQSGAGSIQGTVTDSTGAVIPGASIHVVNQGTGIAAGAADA